MVTKAKGVAKRIAYKKETTFGVPAGTTGGVQLRRVTGDFNLTRDSYESAELRFDHQTADMRLGTRKAEGSIDGELSPGTYSDFIGSIIEKDFVAGATATGLSVTIAGPLIPGTFDTFTITRAAGSFLTDTFKVGTVVRLTGAGLNTDNVSNNLLVTNVTALVLSVKGLSSVRPVAEGPIASVGVTTVGKISYVPQTGHTDQSFTVEQWFSDIAQSEVYTGLKLSGADIALPATGLVTSKFSFTGSDLAQTGTSAYFPSPTVANTKGIFSAVNGALLIDGTDSICVTSMDFKIERALEASTCLGTNSACTIFTGRVKVTGNFSAYLEDGSIRDIFATENKIGLSVVLTSTEDKNSDVMTFYFPNVKLTSATKADAELAIIQTAAFTALLNTSTTNGDIDSTLLVQDSTL